MTVRPGAFRTWLELLLCNALWGSQFVLVKLVQDDLGPVATTFFPILLATVVLATIEVRNDRPPLQRVDLLAFAVLGIFGQVAAQLLVTWGSRFSTASHASLIQFSLPVITAVMAMLFLGERLSPARWVALAIALAGVLLSAGFGSEDTSAGTASLRGNLLILGGVCGSAFYNVASKRLLVRRSPIEVLLGSYVATVLALAPVLWVIEPGALAQLATISSRAWFGLLLLAMGPYLLAMIVFLRVLSRLDAAQTAVSNYLIPIFGVALGAAILGERPTVAMAIGGLLVLASTVVSTVRFKKDLSA